jgi:microsomal dipeptidase-like Zn-dependent dipeptidase
MKPGIDLPRVDLHSHAGRCFLAGLPAGHSTVAAMGAAAIADAMRAARAAGMTALVLSAVADFGTEIIRLVEAAGPDHLALGTDLDGNYRPVLTSYDQLDDLNGLLAARGLAAESIHQILGGNALEFLGRVL